MANINVTPLITRAIGLLPKNTPIAIIETYNETASKNENSNIIKYTNIKINMINIVDADCKLNKISLNDSNVDRTLTIFKKNDNKRCRKSSKYTLPFFDLSNFENAF